MNRDRRFTWWVVGVGALALAVRLTYVFVSRRDWSPGGDALFYHASANLIADGKGFINPYTLPRHVAAADHPPLYTLFLAIPSVLGMHSVLTHIVWSCVLGTATAVIAALVGREVVGERAGIIAGVIVAIYPNMWAPDGMLEAESLGMLLVTLAVLLAYRYWKSPSRARLVWIGVVCGLAALTRSELVLLFVFLVLPLALLRREQPMRARWISVGASAAAVALVIAPWTLYNQTRFEHPVVLSTQFGPLLSSANCDSTYYGAYWGYFDLNCTRAVAFTKAIPDNADESEVDRLNRQAALEYIQGHLSRLPAVENVRLMRVMGLVRPETYVNVDSLVDGREHGLAWSALYSWYIGALLAVAGGLVIRRRGIQPLFPLLAPIAVVVLTTLMTYASTRFRSTAEPAVSILAAVAIDAAIAALLARRRARQGAGREPEPALSGPA